MSVIYDAMAQRFLAGEFSGPAYEWDSWRSTFYFMSLDADIVERLAVLSDEAVNAMTLAMLEWVCARHAREPMVAQVLEYIDAVWTSNLTGEPVALVEFDGEIWRGPTLEPLRFSQLIANEIPYEASEDGNFLARASWAYHLALHIVGSQRASFVAWFDENLRSLAAAYPFGQPRWRSIFDEAFAPARRCPPNMLLGTVPHDAAGIERGIHEQVNRTKANRYLTALIVPASS